MKEPPRSTQSPKSRECRVRREFRPNSLIRGDDDATTSGISAFISVISKRRDRRARVVLSWCGKINRGQRPQERRNAATDREEERRGVNEGERMCERTAESDRDRARERERESRSTGPRDARLVRAGVCRASYPNPTQAVGGIKRSTEAR